MAHRFQNASASGSHVERSARNAWIQGSATAEPSVYVNRQFCLVCPQMNRNPRRTLSRSGISLSGGPPLHVKATSRQLIGNNLLQALRSDGLALLLPHLEHWVADTGYVLHEPGDDVRMVYFPCGPTIVSFLVVLDDGRAVETGLVGREGVVGGVASQGRLPAYARAQVQFGGPLLRMATKDLQTAKEQSAALRNLFSRYADCLVAQIFQSVACNAAHTLEQRAARWILATIERTGEHALPLTQEQLAMMLGVGRSYFSRVLQSLKARGLVETRRGYLMVTDADKLEHLACRCNHAFRAHFETVLRGVYPEAGDEP